MNLIEIRNRLWALALNIEDYAPAVLSEELIVISDCIGDVEKDITGAISEFSRDIKDKKFKDNDIW